MIRFFRVFRNKASLTDQPRLQYIFQAQPKSNKINPSIGGAAAATATNPTPGIVQVWQRLDFSIADHSWMQQPLWTFSVFRQAIGWRN